MKMPDEALNFGEDGGGDDAPALRMAVRELVAAGELIGIGEPLLQPDGARVPHRLVGEEA